MKPETKKQQNSKDSRKKELNAKPTVEELQKQLAQLDSDYRKRIIEKERYINLVEDEKDAAIANKDLVIDSLRADIARLNKTIAELRSRLVKYNRWGLFYRLFGKKK